MSSSPRRTADFAAFVALALAAIITNLSLTVWTDVEPLIRWLLTIGAGIVAAALTFLVVSRRIARRE